MNLSGKREERDILMESKTMDHNKVKKDTINASRMQ